ncbi:MAG TPA: TrkA family potassium uptake protein [Bacteroidetes bacterium]|nr:TrkA family potassium uptake protein [Bacteroidota bacterium]
MASFVVIGLGSFGYYVARFLAENGVEVLAIDADENQVEKIKPFVEKAVIADATQKNALEQLGVTDIDAAVVSVGDKIDQSVLITLYLREMKVKQIIVKSITEDHAKILDMIGATDVIFPEKDAALKIVQTLVHPNILDALSLGPEYSIFELAPPAKFLRKTLRELDIRNKHHIQVIAIKELVPENLVAVPAADYIIKDSDILVVIGKISDVEKIRQLN